MSPLDLLFNFKHNIWYLSENIIISLIFLADIPFVISRMKKIQSHAVNEEMETVNNYYRYWLVFDVIAVIPFTLFPVSPIFGLMRLAKLVRIGRTMYFWQHQEMRHRYGLRLIFTIYWMTLIVHGMACGWQSLRGIDPDRTKTSQYTESLYWTVSTVTTIGYGDVSAKSTEERVYAIFAMILGLAFYGYLVGNVASLLAKQDPARSAYLENLERLSMATKHRHIPPELQMKLFEYYTYLWRKKIGIYESELLEKLPPGLRREVASFMKKDVIEKVPLFSGANPNFLREISVLLKPELSSPGEFLFHADDTGKEMYFILTGELEVIGKNGNIDAVLVDGDYFGEIALFMDVKRTASIRAVTYCEMYSLSKESFDYVIGRYPGIASKIESKIRERMPSNPGEPTDQSTGTFISDGLVSG